MEIGLTIFLKSLVVGIWVIIVERWLAFKERRKAKGIPLKLNSKTGIYSADDWPEKVEGVVRRTGKVLMGTVFALIILIYGTWLVFGRETTRQLIVFLFF